jgi:AmpE protein
MNFLALLLSYFLQQKLDLSLSGKFDNVTLRLLRPQQFSLMTKTKGAAFVLVLLIGAAYFSLTYALFFYIEPLFFGVISLVCNVLLLLLLLGQTGFKDHLTSYLEAWRRGDFEAAAFKQQKLSGINARRLNDPVNMQNEVCAAILYHNFNRFFIIIFWFVLAGPAAAVAVRVVDVVSRHSSHQLKVAATWVKKIVEWIPVRLLALSFALAGDFKGAFKYSLNALVDIHSDSSAVLRGAASGALDNYDMNFVVDSNMPLDTLIAKGTTGITAIRELLSRSMALWLGVFAVVAIFLG